MKKVASGTIFDNTIDLISGQKFPDLVVNNYYGIEVKATKSNSWKTMGNSVLETTRVENVERIYLFFGKLINPAEFRYRRYEECLYDVAVTHSPRYLIDMDREIGDTIFDKIGMDYDVLRSTNNPAKEIMKYYKTRVW